MTVAEHYSGYVIPGQMHAYEAAERRRREMCDSAKGQASETLVSDAERAEWQLAADVRQLDAAEDAAAWLRNDLQKARDELAEAKARFEAKAISLRTVRSAKKRVNDLFVDLQREERNVRRLARPEVLDKRARMTIAQREAADAEARRVAEQKATAKRVRLAFEKAFALALGEGLDVSRLRDALSRAAERFRTEEHASDGDTITRYVIPTLAEFRGSARRLTTWRVHS